MNSIKQFFSYMNDISFNYVVLRNWDGLPYDVVLGEHSDLDLLVYDFSHFFEIFPEAKLEYPFPRVRTKIAIEDSFLYADIRYVGDGYYPTDFEQAILDTREWNSRGFFTPNPIHHRIALAYHVAHHKNYMSSSYRQWLGDATEEELLKVLKQSTVGYSTPVDPTVGRFNPYWKGCTSIVSRANGNIVKTQTNYKEYDLIWNEQRILSTIKSTHFPLLYKYENGSIELEDCGENLSIENLPDNWESQLDEIMRDLNTANVIHRDIRMDNLMIKDGVIKLIDFGWAKFKDEVEAKEPPSCLGFPNKPSTGFSDEYSMRCIRKQIEVMIEDKVCA